MAGFSITTQIYINYYHNLPQFTTLLINCCFFGQKGVSIWQKTQNRSFGKYLGPTKNIELQN
jgi:hypothetical protein